ncbi:MAG: hypothetical protein GX300_05495 [Tissierellia bacterium]|nr:hypothetical protein [Tissierellia bacterium]
MEILKAFIKDIDKQEQLINKFDMELWSSLVDLITVYNKENILIMFRNGMEITV